MSDQIRIHRHATGNRFVLIPNALAQDSALSFGARGLLVHLLSLPANWTIRITEVMNHGTEGKARFYSLKRELEAAGYLRGWRERDARGVIVATVWEVSDVPFNRMEPEAEVPVDDAAENPVGNPLSEKPECGENPVGSPLSGKPDSGYPDSGKPDSGKPDSGNPPTTKTHQQKQINKDGETNSTPSDSPISLPVWDEHGMQYQQMPWEDAHHNLDQGFIAWLVDLWSGPGKDKATVTSMTLLFLRKCRRSQADYQKTADHWLMYQTSRQEQEQQAQQNARSEEERAERDKWMGMGY